MRLLVIVGHPAHVHFFRNTISELEKRGHQVLVGAIKKETTTDLLRAYGIEYAVMGENKGTLVGKVLDLPAKDLRFVRYLHQHKPDAVLSINSPYASHACAATSVPHIMFCDTEVASVILRLTEPFSDLVVTPASFDRDFGGRHVRYRGYKELAYLHPNRFKPDPGVLDSLGAKPGDRLILARFGSWDSSHDLDGRRLQRARDERLVSLVNSLKDFGRVLLTSERRLPASLQQYLLRLPLEKIHSVLYYSTLYFGEGATMASEAGILDTPWIFVSPSHRGYLDDQQSRYSLGYWERTDEAALERAATILSQPDIKRTWAQRRAHLLSETVDVTEFIVDLVEGWPQQRLPRMAVLNHESRPPLTGLD